MQQMPFSKRWRTAFLVWALFGVPFAIVMSINAYDAHERHRSLSALVAASGSLDQLNRVLRLEDNAAMERNRQFVYDNMDDVERLRSDRNPYLLLVAWVFLVPAWVLISRRFW